MHHVCIHISTIESAINVSRYVAEHCDTGNDQGHSIELNNKPLSNVAIGEGGG